MEITDFPALDTTIIVYETRLQLAEACMRFSEHLESPEWRGKYFTPGEFLTTYKSATGTYASDWRGHNLDLTKLDAAAWRAFGISAAEEALLAAAGARTYVVATSSEAPACLWHELSHAVWRRDLTYQTAATNLVREAPELCAALGEYHHDLMNDEAMAYLVTRGGSRITDSLPARPELTGVARGLLASALGSLNCLVAAARLADRYPPRR